MSQVKPLIERRRKKRWAGFRVFKIGSIFQWTLSIFFIVTLPLILTLLYSVWSIQEYTSQGTKLFFTIKVSNDSQALSDHLLNMDRSIQQYQVLGDAEIFEVFQTYHYAFSNLAHQISLHPLPEKFHLTLLRLEKNEADLYRAILDHKDLEDINLNKGDNKFHFAIKEDIQGYLALREDVNTLVMQGDKQITLQTKSLSSLAGLVKEKVTSAALGSVGLAFLLGPLLLYLINKPIQNIGHSIRNLGDEQLKKRIYIEGPKDLREVGRYLEWLRNKLNHLENTKHFFIKTISHELKTPLASLMEGADLLQDEVVGKLNAEQHKIIELVQIANINLNILIENLLEYQKSTSTLVNMQYSQFNINQVIEDICSDYQLLLGRKKVAINLEGQSIDLNADRDKIRIVISNLLSNALKHSPEGGDINIKLETIGQYLYLLVADQGAGIPKNQLPHIFTEFSRQETPDDWKIKGSGLGLSLVKGYITAHEGRVSLLGSTKEYCGAHFLIKLPLTPQRITQDKHV